MILSQRFSILSLLFLSNLFLVIKSEWNNSDFLSQFENKSIEMIRIGSVNQYAQSRAAATCVDSKAGLKCNDCSSILVRMKFCLRSWINLFPSHFRSVMVLQSVLVLFRVLLLILTATPRRMPALQKSLRIVVNPGQGPVLVLVIFLLPRIVPSISSAMELERHPSPISAHREWFTTRACLVARSRKNGEIAQLSSAPVI